MSEPIASYDVELHPVDNDNYTHLASWTGDLIDIDRTLTGALVQIRIRMIHHREPAWIFLDRDQAAEIATALATFLGETDLDG